MDPQNPETWLSLKQIKAAVPEGKWAHSRIYEDINVGIAVGHAADFWELPDEMQAYLIARYRTEGIKQAFEDKLHEEKMKTRNKNRTARPGGHR